MAFYCYVDRVDEFEVQTRDGNVVHSTGMDWIEPVLLSYIRYHAQPPNIWSPSLWPNQNQNQDKP